MKRRLSRKKKVILIAVGVFALSVSIIVVSLSVKEKSQTISGDWEMIVNPEIAETTSEDVNTSQKVYYNFSEPGKYGDGTYKTIFDGGIETGEYKLSEKDGKSYIDMGTVNLEYRIVNSELTITYPGNSDEPTEDYVFSRAKAPDYEKESYDLFETDAALIGEWVTNERTLSYYANELSYTESVEFLKNGVMVINYFSEELLLDRDMYYAYTTENNSLIFSLVTDKETEYQVSYALDKDGNLKFENDDTSFSIFADAFFSDVTYYPKELK